METWVWIVIALVVLLAGGAFIGWTLARKKQISLKDAPAATVVEKPGEAPPKGGYKAGGSISFSAGAGGTAVAPKPVAPKPEASEPTVVVKPLQVPVEHPVAERTEVDGQPGVGDDASVPRDSERPEVIDVELPDAPAVTAAPELPVVPELPVAPEPAPYVLPDVPVSNVPVFAPVDRPAERDVPAAALPPIEEPGLDEIEPADGRLGRLRSRLARSQNAFGKSLLGLLGAGTLDEDSWTDIEDTLLMADLGAGAATEITDKLRHEVATHGISSAADARALLRKVMVEALDPSMNRSIKALPHDGRPSVLLVVGVNGTGKTTTTGKLARVLVGSGHTVVLGAADTFRAAAADQLQTWGERVGASVVRSHAGADPAAVAFDAVKKGIEDGVDAVLIDTAGRLHTKTGLMDELGKVKRVIEKQAEVDEVLLVLDATTGQNGMVQAKVFAEVVKVTGIVLTKLDGTAKGGIVVAVQRALGVPVKLVGLGEGPDDLAPFEPGAFVDALLGD